MCDVSKIYFNIFIHLTQYFTNWSYLFLALFQRSVSHSADAEYNLYNRIKNAEYQRQQQEQAVRKLRTKLNEVKRNNSVQLRLQMTEQERNERDLEQQLLREQAKLAQVTCLISQHKYHVVPISLMLVKLQLQYSGFFVCISS